MSSIGSIALSYTQKLNFFVFPLKPRSKLPATPHGFKDATKDVAVILQWWEQDPTYNVGLRTGIESGVWVLDVDGQTGIDDLAALEAKHGALPLTPSQTTANGKHYLFKYPFNLTIGNKAKLIKHDTPGGLDVRGNGGYIVLPPSIHPDSGLPYKWDVKPSKTPFADTPQWLLDLVITQPLEIENTKKSHMLQSARLSSIRRDTSPSAIMDDQIRLVASAGEGSRNDTTNIAAFKAGRVIGGSDDISYQQAEKSLVDAAMSTGLSHAEALRTVQSGLAAGMKDPYKYGQYSNGSDTFSSSPDFDKETGEIYEPSKFINPLDIKGLIGDTVRWICETAIMEQPELALLNVLAFAGAVFGRRYASPLDTRTNIYFVGIADTGQGKDHSRKMINRLASEAGLSIYLGANSIRSGAGLAQSMKSQASQLLMVDEFGLFLQALSDPKAAAYHREISKMLMTLFSDSSGIYHHGILADSKAEPIILVQPALSLYGTTTLGSYTPALRLSSIESGNLNRFIVLPSKQNVSIKRNPSRSMPESLVQEWARFVDSTIGIKNPCSEKPSYVCEVKYAENISVSDAIYDMQCEGLEKCRSTQNGQLWGRYAENSLKIAMIMAIARNPYEPKINMEDLEFGKTLVLESINFMDGLAQNYMAENEQEADKLAILRFIKNSKKTKSEILTKFRRIKKRELDDILAALLEEGIVTHQKQDSKTRKAETYSA